jgi:hypothetical protein
MNYSRSQSLGSLIRLCGPRLTGPLRVLVAGPVAAGDACPRQSPFELGETKSDAEALNQLCLRRRPKHRREWRHGRFGCAGSDRDQHDLGSQGVYGGNKEAVCLPGKLSAYQANRDFALTGEPTGGAEPQVGPRLRFVVQRHAVLGPSLRTRCGIQKSGWRRPCVPRRGPPERRNRPL